MSTATTKRQVFSSLEWYKTTAPIDDKLLYMRYTRFGDLVDAGW